MSVAVFINQVQHIPVWLELVLWFPLGGEFEFRFLEKDHVIGHYQHALLPKGGFDFRVVGDDEAKVLRVWDLREL